MTSEKSGRDPAEKSFAVAGLIPFIRRRIPRGMLKIFDLCVTAFYQNAGVLPDAAPGAAVVVDPAVK